MIKLVKENLNSFVRNQDPISSLGLGGFTFETLYPGALVQIISLFAVAKNQSGKLVPYYKGFTFNNNCMALITEVIDLLDNKKKIRLIRFSLAQPSESMLLYNKNMMTIIRKCVDIYKNEGYNKLRDVFYSIMGTWISSLENCIILSKTQFDRRIKIIEKGNK